MGGQPHDKPYDTGGRPRIRFEHLASQVNNLLDDDPGLEMRLFAAHKAGRLLEYIEGSEFDTIIDSIDNRWVFLSILFRRELFDDTLRLANLLGQMFSG